LLFIFIYNINLIITQSFFGVPPTGGFGMIQVQVGKVGNAGSHFSTIELCLYIRRLLVEALDGGHSTVQNSQRDTMVDNLEESDGGGRAPDLLNDNSAAMIRVDPGEVDGWDEIGFRSECRAGVEVG
jgi:hypothetical protein